MIAGEKNFLDVVIRVQFNELLFLLEEGWLEFASTFVYCYSMSGKLGSAFDCPGHGKRRQASEPGSHCLKLY